MAAQVKQNSTIKIPVNVNLFITMAESAIGQDEANPVFWLAPPSTQDFLHWSAI